MARYTGTFVFEAGPGESGRPVTPALPEHATLRSSSWAGSCLTVVVDLRSSHPATVCREVVDAVRHQLPGTGDPVRVRVLPRRPPQPVEGGQARPREYSWHRDDDGDGHLVLVDAGTDPITAPTGLSLLSMPDDEPAGDAPPAARPTPGLGPLRNALSRLNGRNRSA